jgi:anhydro-N-acetylmuramic acid kinase
MSGIPTGKGERGAARYAVGLMSGTSADGIDAAVVRVWGVGLSMRAELVAHRAFPLPDDVRAEVRRAADPETGTVERICRLNFALAERFAAAASGVVASAGLSPADIAVIGSHGQTIWHIPPDREGNRPGSTLQVGDGSVIAARTGILTVCDFRPADIAAGGQGAPLVPFADAVLFGSPSVHRVIQNIGGIANCTYLPASDNNDRLRRLVAFDSGPGNGLLDAAVRRLGGGPDGCGYDRDGRMAASGRVRADWLKEWLADDYFGRPPPKSTGLERYGDRWLDRQSRRHGDLFTRPGDLLATLAALTVRTILDGYAAAGVPLDGPTPVDVIVAGGGARNPVLMAGLRSGLPRAVRLAPMDEFGLDAAAKEAVSFALLGLATLDGVPSNVPAATGASRAVVLGKVCTP